jgi:hypothetical protein
MEADVEIPFQGVRERPFSNKAEGEIGKKEFWALWGGIVHPPFRPKQSHPFRNWCSAPKESCAFMLATDTASTRQSLAALAGGSFRNPVWFTGQPNGESLSGI